MAEIRIHGGWREVPAGPWDALVGDGSPFLEHAFLSGLETYGCAVPDTGWIPRPITVWEGERLVAGAPGWVKRHSMGEFVYDHGWADAARRAGLGYYPKLVIGVPFSPVTGQRLLVHPELDRARWVPALIRGIQAAAEDCHGAHVLFPTAAEAQELTEAGAFARTQFQFWWLNDGYAHFDDFLGRFSSKSRNKLRRERRDAVVGLRIEAQTRPDGARLRALHRFYTATSAQFGPWGRVYMSADFFEHLGEAWGDRLHSVIAWDGDRPIAGAFNVTKGDRLYGRHWGCVEERKFLHFEICYYQAVDWCIAHGLRVFEPGHGGGHKYVRGFTPQTTWSAHWLAHPGLHDALARHTAHERAAVAEQIAELTEQMPPGLRPR